ncbi:hypothetical protein [Halobacillus sp. BAB-2008]|uniref:hypothetical protein n=1 Tax=Halobacillus sp. BAB-2008 TaxID=1246484 RepID=UPI0002A51CB1|nr:hypothetical protein [Halobacillus sp. BAB-2008]ELK47526.1 hypothetical protein D479_06278 [Halobacillus sp. BAB-2008]
METIVYVFVIALFITANVYAVKWQRDGTADLMISGVLIMIGGILVSITAGACSLCSDRQAKPSPAPTSPSSPSPTACSSSF